MTKDEQEILNILKGKENQKEKKESIETEGIEPLTYDKSMDLLIKNLADNKNYNGLQMLKASMLKAKQTSKMDAIIGSFFSIVYVATDAYLISNFGTDSNLIKLLCLLSAGLVTTGGLCEMLKGLSNFKMYDKKIEKIDGITYSLKQ